MMGRRALAEALARRKEPIMFYQLAGNGSKFKVTNPAQSLTNPRESARIGPNRPLCPLLKAPNTKQSSRRGFTRDSVAGYSGGGFHNWPRGDILQTPDTNALIRIRAPGHAKKTFGEMFGAATGVSDPRRQKIRIKNNGSGGQAATVAGYAGPGFHTWPSGHTPQNTYAKLLPRIRSSPLPKTRSVPRPGSATHGDKRSGSKTTAQAAKPPL